MINEPLNILSILIIFFTVAISYLLGSINFAILITKWMTGDDIREHGSGNAGMTNVLRTVGKKAAFFTFIGDLLKGAIPVFIAHGVFLHFAIATPLIGSYIAGFAALLGHIFPIYYGFKGGKGFLTAAAVILSIDFWVSLPLFIIFILVVFTTKIVSLSTITVAILFPFFTYFIQLYMGTYHWGNLACAVAFSFIILVTHRQNIKRLFAGTEYKFNEKK